MAEGESKSPFCLQNGCQAEKCNFMNRFAKTIGAKRSKRLLQECLSHMGYLTVLLKTDDPRGNF
jgi:hypothetical protein